MIPSQLEDFRAILRQNRDQSCRTIAVASGKGGVGKSTLSANLSLALGSMGRRTLLLDADPGMADLNIILGVNPPFHWGHFISGHKEFEDIIFRDLDEMDLVHGFSGARNMEWMSATALHRLAQGISRVGRKYDVAIMDLGAGVSSGTMLFASNVDLLLLVINDELTSLADAYGAIKTIWQWNSEQRIAVVVNNVASQQEAKQAWNGLVQITERFLGKKPPLLGWLPTAAEMREALVSQQPLVVSQSASPYSAGIFHLADTIFWKTVNRSKELAR